MAGASLFDMSQKSSLWNEVAIKCFRQTAVPVTRLSLLHLLKQLLRENSSLTQARLSQHSVRDHTQQSPHHPPWQIRHRGISSLGQIKSTAVASTSTSTACVTGVKFEHHQDRPRTTASAADMSLIESGDNTSEATEVAALPHAHDKEHANLRRGRYQTYNRVVQPPVHNASSRQLPSSSS
ncbi:hypothetical protein quinque_002273 [Culex quinquefasciatus]